MKRFICWPALALALFAIPAFGAMPRVISYQGVVTDNSGNIISSGSHSFQFNLYNDPTLGTPGTLGPNNLWFENQSLPVALGGFSTQLPSPSTVASNPLWFPFNAQFYLGISVDGGAEMSPRTPLTSAPYSLATRGINVDASDRVGIGTSSPFAPLHVSTGASGAALESGSTSLVLEGNTNGNYLQMLVPNDAVASFTGILFRSPSSPSFGTGITYSVGAGSTNSGGLSFRTDGGGYKMTLSSAGNLAVGSSLAASERLQVFGNICATGTIGTCSDERFKTNVEPMRGALDVVQTLRPVRFDWRTEEFPDRQFSDKRQIGFIAQQVLQSLPEVVAKDRDGYYSVDYGRFAPVLVRAIQELREQKDTEMAALKADNAELRRRLEKLEALMLGSQDPTAEAVK